MKKLRSVCAKIMRFETKFVVLILFGYFLGIRSDDTIHIVVLVGNKQRDIIMSFANTIKNDEYSEKVNNVKIADQYIEINRMEPNRSIDKLCSMFYNGISIILDLTSFDWKDGRDLISATGTIYLKLSSLLDPFLITMDEIVQRRSGNDLVLIFQSDQEVDSSLRYIIEKSTLRVLPLNGFNSDLIGRLEGLRPAPRYYSIFAYTKSMKKIYEMISQSKVFKQSDKWHLVFLDADVNEFDFTTFPDNVTIIKPRHNALGHLSFKEKIFGELLEKIRQTNRVQKIEQHKFNCENSTGTYISKEIDSNEKKSLIESIGSSLILNINDNIISYNLNLSIEKTDKGKLFQVGTWTDGVFKAVTNMSLEPAKRFFRIGTTEAIPWSYFKRDPETQETLLDDDGNPMWEGYCIDLIGKLAEKMSFNYEIVTPRKGTFGNHNANGTWDGLVGDLTIGETDIAVAAMKMTAEREEVIDFIAPYFEQTGISIVIRKPFRQTSLFKFMTVLRLEVWLSIVAALVATAIMIWFIDKYSPYSSRNNSQAYPYPCREFSLKESFWFALTSFTPQGGGEVPKSISARTLVAAYWLFVVLMLATFTANLAAFLTVERMQTPVQSLEQLARQSRINYTVVEGSHTHKYFINMKFAEDTLYRLWKELTLNATSDQSQYRIWDYPIKEQYGHILLAINSSNPVKDAEEGFRQVSAHENADFAFIHDSAEIKYEVSKNCNLTEIGEVFAEQPYAIAVQQGSHLQDELTYAILELQKDRYFEMLTAKYWNNSAKKHCDSVDESEGITLESIGGVFIATLFGLGLAMVTLAFEVLYYKRKELRILKVKPLEEINSKLTKPHKQPNKQKLPSYDEAQRSASKFAGVTLSKEFVPARKRNTKITFIKPRDSIHGPFYYE